MQRRRFVFSTLAGAALTACAPLRHADAAVAACGGLAPTPDDIEGPFFRAGSPLRNDLRIAGEPGRPLLVTGTVRDVQCRPMPGAALEVWHADAAGQYDNIGHHHRGVVRCDSAGRYTLRTVRPGRYALGTGFRPAHVHIKLHAQARPTLTTQLYFPGDPHNAVDPWFDPALLLRLDEPTVAEAPADHPLRARFDFVI